MALLAKTFIDGDGRRSLYSLVRLLVLAELQPSSPMFHRPPDVFSNTKYAIGCRVRLKEHRTAYFITCYIHPPSFEVLGGNGVRPEAAVATIYIPIASSAVVDVETLYIGVRAGFIQS